MPLSLFVKAYMPLLSIKKEFNIYPMRMYQIFRCEIYFRKPCNTRAQI